MSALVSYDDSDDSTGEPDNGLIIDPTKPLSLVPVNAAPIVDETMVRPGAAIIGAGIIDITSTKELTYNPRYEDLFAPALGPVNPAKVGKEIKKNFLTGSIEPAFVSHVTFELERKNFQAYGAASNPSDGSAVGAQINKPGVPTTVDTTDPITAAEETEALADIPDPESITSKKGEKRKKVRNMDSADVDGYTGPWAEFENEIKVSKPNEEESAELADILAKRRLTNLKNRGAKGSSGGVEEEFKERSVLHIKDPYDYQGRSFLHPPHDVDVPLHKPDHAPSRCFLPKKLLHTYTGHSKSVTTIRLFPQSGHLLLSSSMDTKIKLWEVYHERRNVMTYHGHKAAIRDISFNRHGDRFVSAGYDRFLKLWDTETGQCVRKFTNRKIAYCVKFNVSDDSHSHYFLTGMADKKILCWDTRTGNICQEYDRHLGAVNTVTLVDGGRKFVSTSDDKSLRVWDWDIPVDVKYIADPSMHAIPAVSAAPNGKWLACQSMDNKIQAFACMNRFKLNQKKIFTGHMVAGYACQPGFSPDMSYLISGDADGKVFIWDWKTTKLLTTFQAHENVCISALWHPHETSKVITAGWDNTIKLWD